jgi:predicted XRE-type DNA-binding protein
MDLEKDESIPKKFNKALRFKGDEEELNFEIYTLQSDFMTLVQTLMEQKELKSVTIAEKMKVSPGFISQLFSGSKRINFKHLALIQRIFQDKILFSTYSLNLYQDSKNDKSFCIIRPITSSKPNTSTIMADFLMAENS